MGILSEINFNYIVNLSGCIDHSSFFKSGKELIDVHFSSLVNFLLSKDSSWITGQIIGVDGGRSSVA